jgi:hypothetical protein
MIRDLEHRMVTEILSTTRVMCATCIGAAHDLLSDRNFPLVLIDGKPIDASLATRSLILT